VKSSICATDQLRPAPIPAQRTSCDRHIFPRNGPVATGTDIRATDQLRQTPRQSRQRGNARAADPVATGTTFAMTLDNASATDLSRRRPTDARLIGRDRRGFHCTAEKTRAADRSRQRQSTRMHARLIGRDKRDALTIRHDTDKCVRDRLVATDHHATESMEEGCARAMGKSLRHQGVHASRSSCATDSCD
jgi:hypothetical protein